jgi:hypothetical protein
VGQRRTRKARKAYKIIYNWDAAVAKVTIRMIEAAEDLVCPQDGIGPDGRPGESSIPTLVVDQHPRSTGDRARRVLELVEHVANAAVAREEIGDTLELIQRILLDPAERYPRLRTCWIVVRTSVLVVVNSIRHLADRALGRGTE